jgi:hypothetical protein
VEQALGAYLVSSTISNKNQPNTNTNTNTTTSSIFCSMKELRTKALKIAKQTLPPDTPFAASNNWLPKVLERYSEEAALLGLPATTATTARLTQPPQESGPHHAPNNTMELEHASPASPPPTYDEAMDYIIRLSHYADHIRSKPMKNAVGQVSLTMAKIQHAVAAARQKKGTK